MLWRILRRVWRGERGVVRLSNICEAMFGKILRWRGRDVLRFVFMCSRVLLCVARMQSSDGRYQPSLSVDTAYPLATPALPSSIAAPRILPFSSLSYSMA
jgi:hypothetical protein